MVHEPDSNEFVGLVWEARHLARKWRGQPEADLLRQLAMALEGAMFRDQVMRNSLERANHDALSWRCKAKAAEALKKGSPAHAPESTRVQDEAASAAQHLRSIGLDGVADVVGRLNDLNRSLAARAASSAEAAASSMLQRDLFAATLGAELVPIMIDRERLEKVRELTESNLKLSTNVDPRHLDAVLQAADPRASLETIIEFQRKIDEADGP